MTRAQQFIDNLFGMFPSDEIESGGRREQFDQLRSHVASAEDLGAELRRLYRVERCDDLALSLLWVAERVESDPARLDPTSEESVAFTAGLRRGLGLPEPAMPTASEPAFAAEEPSPAPEPYVFEPQPAMNEPVNALPVDEPVADQPAEPAVDGGAGTPAETAEAFGQEPSAGTSDPMLFGHQLDRFLEAIQSGADDREALMADVRASCAVIVVDSAAPEDQRQYAELLGAFLAYVADNQLIDDVRVMNLVTNAQDPYAQWLGAPEEERTGLLDPGCELLREFRPMFE